jgi:hypothetical protein
MPTNTEQTIAKNLDNVRAANSIAESIGAPFNPTNNLIKLAALETFEDECTAAMQAVNDALPSEKNAVGARLTAFKLVSKRVTKILNAAKGQGLAAKSLDNLRSIANEIRGIRVTSKTPDDPLTPDIDESKQSVSASNRSYAGILEALDRFIEQLKSDPNYNPNETEYKIATLEAWLAELNALNTAAIGAKPATAAVRAARDAKMFSPTDGIIPRMSMLKSYVSTILPSSDPRWKQLKKLRFNDLSK